MWVAIGCTPQRLPTPYPIHHITTVGYVRFVAYIQGFYPT